MHRRRSALKAPAAVFVRTFQDFFKLESSSGLLLLASAVAAMVWANSSWADSYQHLWHMPVAFGYGELVATRTLQHWINDGLMTVFFFVVGLEIKREVLVGELSQPRRAALPIAAAVGGMIVPACVYLAINIGTDAAAGWGIPMATDIAFALGALALLKGIPAGLKVFLTALAIADDLGAVLVIAFVYTADIRMAMLFSASGVFLSLFLLNILGIRTPIPYVLLGIALWVLFLNSGVHATVAGVLLALTIPHTPLHRLEHGLHPWVVNVIMPVFALANAGVVLGDNVSSMVLRPVSLGVAAGLIFGKQIGIMLFSWVSTSLGLAVLPSATSWTQMYGTAWLGGIGFTMSLFIATLAFGDPALLDEAKVGILAGSLISGVVGWSLLYWLTPDQVQGTQIPIG